MYTTFYVGGSWLSLGQFIHRTTRVWISGRIFTQVLTCGAQKTTRKVVSLFACKTFLLLKRALNNRKNSKKRTRLHLVACGPTRLFSQESGMSEHPAASLAVFCPGGRLTGRSFSALRNWQRYAIIQPPVGLVGRVSIQILAAQALLIVRSYQ